MASLTKVIAVEWASFGIRVNALAPVYVGTALVDDLARAGRYDINAQKSGRRLADSASRANCGANGYMELVVRRNRHSVVRAPTQSAASILVRAYPRHRLRHHWTGASIPWPARILISA